MVGHLHSTQKFQKESRTMLGPTDRSSNVPALGKTQVGDRNGQSVNRRSTSRQPPKITEPGRLITNSEWRWKEAKGGSSNHSVFGVGEKAWTLLSKKEQRQLKERRNEDLRIAEPIWRVAKWSYPRLLFQECFYVTGLGRICVEGAYIAFPGVAGLISKSWVDNRHDESFRRAETSLPNHSVVRLVALPHL
uniref:Uncharacterized protein n=1 Tax=Solanum tuberosum TaxID=4113 RepID=M1DPB5_SOLTU